MEENAFHIGIIGLGPKGFYGFERLLANLQSIKFANVEIHLFNLNNLFATGWIYDPNQPDYLKMNYPNKLISLQPPKDPSAIIKILSFSQWQANQHNSFTEEEDYQIASRADVGTYLLHYFDKLCASSAKNIKIRKHVAKVTSIDKIKEDYFIQTENKQFESPRFSSLLITTGHSPSIASKLSESHQETNKIPFIYPVEEKLSSIQPTSMIACKGMGLTAIDAILALTEGRGGEFKLNTQQEWSYRKSGKEPLKIYPFSISGIPIIPRNPHPLGSQQSFFFKRYMEDFDSQPKLFDFEKELLPLIEQDMMGEYYFQLFKNYDKFLDLNNSYAEVEDEIRKFHHQYPLEKRFEAIDLFYPKFNAEKLNLELPTYWKMWLAELKRRNSPLVAAAGTWKNISADFNKLYSGNRLTTSSKAKFIKTYFSLFNRVAYGPPVINIEKMLAIAEQGILDFSFAKNPSIDEINGKSKLILNQNLTSFDVLIDARIPRGYGKNSKVLYTEKKSEAIFTFNESKNQGPLDKPKRYELEKTFQKLRDKPVRTARAGHRGIESSGGIKLDHADTLMCNEHGNPLDENGNIDTNICLYGTPTEGFLFDNDTLSRKRNDTASLWAKNVVETIKKKTKK